MEIYWQSILVIALVGLAVAYLVVKQIGRRKAKCACSGCPAIKRSGRSGTYDSSHSSDVYR